MWYLTKELNIDSAHQLKNYVGRCANLHGHRWKVVVHCKGDTLDNHGMLVDFCDIKSAINKFDHEYLNDMFPETINPTAENLAKYFCDLVPNCYQVDIYETPTAKVTYVKGE